MITFEQFQASCLQVEDVGEYCEDECVSGVGRVYPIDVERHMYVNIQGDGSGDGWTMLLDRSDFTSKDLPNLEHMLYEYCVSEGFFDDVSPDVK
jgi:hypothetical protein